MEPDKFQQAWRAHSSETQLTVDPDLLLKEVRRNQQTFKATIFVRDCVEVGVALVMLPFWMIAGIALSLPWTWYLTVFSLLWVAGFLLIDQKRHKRDPSEPGEPLASCVRESLRQIEHQIWLLRNIFWWYLLPFTLSILAFFVHTTWRIAQDWLQALVLGGSLCGFVLVIYSFIYYLNQRAVRVQFEPRRRELIALLNGLGEGPTNGESGMSTDPGSIKTPGRSWRVFLIVTLCGGVLAGIALAGGLFDSGYHGVPRSNGPAGQSLAELITKQRKQKHLVGLAAMVMVDGQVLATAADGERMKGKGVPIELNDRWHLGSITKSITATMIARLIEAGRMQWSDSIGQHFPDASIHDDWKPVTLQQLLTHTSGAPANFSLQVRLKQPALGPDSTRERRAAVVELMAEAPEHSPGQKFAYSNVGYTIAGAMAEKVTGLSWEDLVKQEVFKPLALTEAGFGPPKSSLKTLEQPRGHRTLLGQKFGVNDTNDNTPIMGPAGTVHMTLSNLSKYATDHLNGELGTGKLLAAETYKRLHTPQLDHNACGWVKNEPSEKIPYTVYWHNGSNTMWYALVVFIPEKRIAVAVTSNDGDVANAEAAAWQIVDTSVKQIDDKTLPTP